MSPSPRRCVQAIFLLLSVFVATGCVSTADGRQLDNELREAVFYIERQSKDGRNLAANIAEAFRERGYEATSGEQSSHPGKADYIVSYVDRWQWDMRMYLMSLRVEVRDRRTSQLVGYGESQQSSLAAMGKSHDDVIERALEKLLGAS